jgi:hypothetical protein
MSGFPVGRLNNLDAEPGTILGPDTAGEFLVVAARDGNGVLVSYATVDDIAAARAVVAESGARSMTERLWEVAA